MTLKDKDIIVPNEEELSDKDVVSFYNAFNSSFDKLKKEHFDDKKDNLLSGNKTIYNKTIIESKTFDDGFIDILEKAYPSFSKISRDPKRSLKYESDVVSVEKAHKINSESIRHLASHTQFLRQVKRNGDVIPDKLLTTFAEEDIAIYENRVYKTLVNIIINFLTRRLQILEENVNSNKTDEIKFNNKMKVSGGTFDIDLNIKMVRPMVEANKRSQTLVDKIENMLIAYKGLKGTQFMKELAHAKDVVPPLLKTNIFLHNPDFKIIYNTWIFMERYQTEPYGINIKEIDYKNDDLVSNDLSKQSLALINELMYLRSIKDVETSISENEIENNVEHVLDIKHDISFNPGEFEVEKYYPSEILLQKTLNLYKQNYESKQVTLDSKEVSARKTIDDMLNAVNSITNNLYDYKDTDIDKIGVPTEQILLEQKKRYLMLKILREEKEIDLETTRLQEKLALEHLNSIEKHLNEEITKSESLARKELSQRYKQIQKDILKEREEAFKHQLETIEKHKEELERLAQERAVMVGKRGFHSVFHNKKSDRIKCPLAIYDNIKDDLLELDNFEKDFIMKSKRDYSNSNRKTYNEILEKVLEERRIREELLRQEMLRLMKEQKELQEAFKSNHKHKLRKETREKRHLEIWDDTPTLDLFKKDKIIIVRRFKGTNRIMIGKSKAKKVIGTKKTLIKKVKVDEPKKKARKVIATKKKLVSKKVIKK